MTLGHQPPTPFLAPSIEEKQFLEVLMKCQICGRRLPSENFGRPKRYCSASCRQKAYRSRQGAPTVSITEKSRATVVAAQALLAEMIADVAARDPEMAQAVAFSVERGALFEVQVLFDLDRPHITLSCVDGGGRGERRTVSTVKLAVPASH